MSSHLHNASRGLSAPTAEFLVYFCSGPSLCMGLWCCRRRLRTDSRWFACDVQQQKRAIDDVAHWSQFCQFSASFAWQSDVSPYTRTQSRTNVRAYRVHSWREAYRCGQHLYLFTFSFLFFVLLTCSTGVRERTQKWCPFPLKVVVDAEKVKPKVFLLAGVTKGMRPIKLLSLSPKPLVK